MESSIYFFFFSSRRRHTRWPRDWSSDVCSSDLDVDVDRQHPLAEALGTLPRETRYEHVALTGLERPAVQALLEAIAEAAIEPALAEAVARETSGNPFFIREVLLHLLEEGALARDGTQWRAGLPAGTW